MKKKDIIRINEIVFVLIKTPGWYPGIIYQMDEEKAVVRFLESNTITPLLDIKKYIRKFSVEIGKKMLVNCADPELKKGLQICLSYLCECEKCKSKGGVNDVFQFCKRCNNTIHKNCMNNNDENDEYFCVNCKDHRGEKNINSVEHNKMYQNIHDYFDDIISDLPYCVSENKMKNAKPKKVKKLKKVKKVKKEVKKSKKKKRKRKRSMKNKNEIPKRKKKIRKLSTPEKTKDLVFGNSNENENENNFIYENKDGVEEENDNFIDQYNLNNQFQIPMFENDEVKENMYIVDLFNNYDKIHRYISLQTDGEEEYTNNNDNFDLFNNYNKIHQHDNSSQNEINETDFGFY